MNYKHTQIDKRLFLDLTPQDTRDLLIAYAANDFEGPGPEHPEGWPDNFKALLTKDFNVGTHSVEFYEHDWHKLIVEVDGVELQEYLAKHELAGQHKNLLALGKNTYFPRSHQHVVVDFTSGRKEYLLIPVITEIPENSVSNADKRLLNDIFTMIDEHPIKRISTHPNIAENIVVDVMLPLWSRFEAALAQEIDYINRYYSKAMRGMPIQMDAIRRRDDPWYVRVIIKPKHSYTVR